ncbi:MAG: hypothetical protein KAT05_10870 [Spirochaetes bacterium]|nr:hypothetical protein [Spirochaetota bacterium]
MGEQALREFHLKVNDVFAAINFIKISSEVDEFKNWLKIEHGIKKFDTIFEGYKFFLESEIRTLLNVLIYNSSFDIDEDFIFYRARFTGVNINKIPNTCEKIIFIKHIYGKLRLVKKANGWDELKDVLNNIKIDILDVFEEILKNNVSLAQNLNINKQDALNYITQFYAYIYLNDTSRYIPHGFWVSILDNDIKPKKLMKNFEGYKYSLQFLWFKLLNEKYHSTSVKNLHLSKNWHHGNDFVFLPSYNMTESIEDGDDTLDSYFGKIQSEIINPLEKELNVSLAFNKILYLNNKYSKSLFKSLLKPIKEPTLTEKEKLDYELLWYQIEFLDSSRNHIFNGITTFISLLIGASELKRIYGDGDKAYISKFIHPVKSVKGNDFTYGVLIEAFSGISDYSGWILFFDACGDHSGFSGSEHARAEMFIEEYKEKDLIEVRETIIDKNKLKEYIADKIIPNNQTIGFETKGKFKRSINKKDYFLNELEEESIRRKNNDILNEAKGLVLELLTYYTLSKNYTMVDWNIKITEGQLDVMFEDFTNFTIVECKINPNNGKFEKQITKLQKKLASYKTKKSKKCEFWFWERPKKQTLEKLKKANINYEIFPELIKVHPILERKKFDKLKNIFKEE